MRRPLSPAGPTLRTGTRSTRTRARTRKLPEGDRFNLPFEELARDRFLIGSPDTVIRGVEELLDIGYNHIIFYTQHPGLPGDLALKCYKMLGEKVLPAFRS